MCRTWFFQLDFSKIKYRWIGRITFFTKFWWPSGASLQVPAFRGQPSEPSIQNYKGFSDRIYRIGPNNLQWWLIVFFSFCSPSWPKTIWGKAGLIPLFIKTELYSIFVLMAPPRPLWTWWSWRSLALLFIITFFFTLTLTGIASTVIAIFSWYTSLTCTAK